MSPTFQNRNRVHIFVHAGNNTEILMVTSHSRGTAILNSLWQRPPSSTLPFCKTVQPSTTHHLYKQQHIIFYIVNTKIIWGMNEWTCEDRHWLGSQNAAIFTAIWTKRMLFSNIYLSNNSTKASLTPSFLLDSKKLKCLVTRRSSKGKRKQAWRE